MTTYVPIDQILKATWLHRIFFAHARVMPTFNHISFQDDVALTQIIVTAVLLECSNEMFNRGFVQNGSVFRIIRKYIVDLKLQKNSYVIRFSCVVE